VLEALERAGKLDQLYPGQERRHSLFRGDHRYAIILCVQKLSDSDSATRTRSPLTLRGVDAELRAALDAEAARSGMSLNALILHILRVSLGSSGPEQVSHDLDALAGSWSAEDAEEFAAAVRPFDEIEPGLWRDEPESV